MAMYGMYGLSLRQTIVIGTATTKQITDHTALRFFRLKSDQSTELGVDSAMREP
jgi:hypothetical protein